MNYNLFTILVIFFCVWFIKYNDVFGNDELPDRDSISSVSDGDPLSPLVSIAIFNRPICYGALITSNWVLTSAQCVDIILESAVSSSLSKADKNKRGERRILDGPISFSSLRIQAFKNMEKDGTILSSGDYPPFAHSRVEFVQSHPLYDKKNSN